MSNKTKPIKFISTKVSKNSKVSGTEVSKSSSKVSGTEVSKSSSKVSGTEVSKNSSKYKTDEEGFCILKFEGADTGSAKMKPEPKSDTEDEIEEDEISVDVYENEDDEVSQDEDENTDEESFRPPLKRSLLALEPIPEEVDLMSQKPPMCFYGKFGNDKSILDVGEDEEYDEGPGDSNICYQAIVKTDVPPTVGDLKLAFLNSMNSDLPIKSIKIYKASYPSPHESLVLKDDEIILSDGRKGVMLKQDTELLEKYDINNGDFFQLIANKV